MLFSFIQKEREKGENNIMAGSNKNLLGNNGLIEF